MKLRIIASLAAAAMLSGAPAFAQDQQRDFFALQGVDAQALSADEMQAIAGRLNAYDTADALYALASTLTNPHQQAATIKKADSILANAETINAFYARMGVLTPCSGPSCPAP